MGDPTRTPASKTSQANSRAVPEGSPDTIPDTPPDTWGELLGGGELDMRIATDGTWFYQGTPIRREALVKLFSTVLRREDDGSFWLVTPIERGRVVVEDAPFLAVEFQHSGKGRDQRISFRTNVDDWVELGADHPLRVEEQADNGEPRPYMMVRDGLEARLIRSVFYHLVELAEPKEEGKEESFGVWSNSCFFRLGRQ